VKTTKEKERGLSALKQQTATLGDENARLRGEVKSAEDRGRAEQSRLLSDVQRQLDSQDRALKSLSVLRDPLPSSTSALGAHAMGGGLSAPGNATMLHATGAIPGGLGIDRKVANLSSQVKKLGSALRAERFEKDAILQSPYLSPFRSTQPPASLRGASHAGSSTLRDRDPDVVQSLDFSST
jgi:hypothetical protein